MERVLVTGAAGFVGRELVSKLASAGFELTLAARRRLDDADIPSGPHRQVEVGDISGSTDWRDALSGCSVVVHLAAQTPGRGVPEERFRVVNNEATAALTEQAAASGVERFIFGSSIFAVTDNASSAIVSDLTPPAPASAYGSSKLAAEAHVSQFAASGRRAGVSLRSPVVYGGAARGNWGLLQKLAASGLPLPLGAVHNLRTMISVVNLVDAIKTVTDAGQNAPSGAFAVADSEAISLTEMLRLLRKGMGFSPRLIPVPPALLWGPLWLAGKKTIANSLFGDLVVDAGRFREAFGWSPPEDAREGIRRSGADYMAEAKGAPAWRG